MKHLFMLLLLCIGAISGAEDVPNWIMVGILKVETSSSYKPDGTIRYVDKRRGANGERGAFQMTKIAFNQVKRRGEQFLMIETDPYFAELMAKRYLLWLYKNTANRDWYETIQQYNAGPSKKSKAYLARVIDSSKKGDPYAG